MTLCGSHYIDFYVNFLPRIDKFTNSYMEYIKTKGIFGNCFFPLFSVFKNNFLFLRLKNLFGNSKRVENKNYFQNSICEGN